MGALVMCMIVVPPIYGRFYEPTDMHHNYPRAINIMAHVNGSNWHQESFVDLEDEDFIWGAACVASKRMGLWHGAQVDEYPMFNRLMYMALNDAQGEYH
jgi:hypothetical protein